MMCYKFVLVFYLLFADGHHIWEMEAKVNRESSKSVSLPFFTFFFYDEKGSKMKS